MTQAPKRQPPRMKSTITPEQVQTALKNGYVVDLGQIDTGYKKWLEKAAREGEYIKCRAWWPYMVSGTVIKTFYVRTKAEDK